MRKDLAHLLSEQLAEGGFTSTVEDNMLFRGKDYRAVLVIEHDLVDSALACQHLEEFIEQSIIEENSEFVSEYDIDHLSKLNKDSQTRQTLLY